LHWSTPKSGDPCAHDLRKSGSGFAWDRDKKVGGSVTPLMAATLARHTLLAHAPMTRPVVTPVPLADTTTRGDDDDQPAQDLLRIPF